MESDDAAAACAWSVNSLTIRLALVEQQMSLRRDDSLA